MLSSQARWKQQHNGKGLLRCTHSLYNTQHRTNYFTARSQPRSDSIQHFPLICVLILSPISCFTPPLATRFMLVYHVTSKHKTLNKGTIGASHERRHSWFTWTYSNSICRSSMFIISTLATKTTAPQRYNCHRYSHLFKCISGYCYKLSHDLESLEREFQGLSCVCCKVRADTTCEYS